MTTRTRPTKGRVVLVGLLARPELNHCVCKLTSKKRTDNSEGRVSVRLLSSDEEIWVRESNTRPVERHEQMPKRETDAVYSERMLRALAGQGLGVPTLLVIQPIAGAV